VPIQNRLVTLDDAGTSVWLDYIRRKLVQSGELQRMVDEDGLRGMTSNPTIFEKAISGSNDYDVQIRDLVGQGKEPLEIFQIISTDDIREACDTLRPVYDNLERYDGYVSIEVSPAGATDTRATLDEARHLWSLVDRPNVMIKVPGTEEGLPAIEQLISEGININITLLFDVNNYDEVAERYIRGLERRLDAGQPIDHVASVASFFVSRVDTVIDKTLQERIEAENDAGRRQRLEGLLGKAAIANAKIAYEHFGRIFQGPRWQRLANAGAMLQRPLWASTSTKNPAYRDVMYVEQLIGPDTVNTMPQATMNAFKDHGVISPTLTDDVEGAHRIIEDLAEIDISIDEVTRQLQVDGVRLFAESFDALIQCIDDERTAITMGMQHAESESLGNYQAAVEKELARLKDDQFLQKLWAKDGSVWSDDPEEQQAIKEAMGWLTIVEPMLEQVDDLEKFADEVRSEGIEQVVVLGMGGSSLCPDVLAHTFPHADGYPSLQILDTTHPEAVEALANSLDLPHTLFVVSSKSGTTAEPLAFYHYFWSLLEETGIEAPARQFVAITDPGTKLEGEARDKGFRRVFSGSPDIGGRYSALSNFGMVPAALMGIDVRALLSRAETMVHATQPCVAPNENPGVRLGTILGVLAREGRDKLTLATSPQIRTLGWWIEQLIAESTGKSGTGILPVEGERLGSPDEYGDDRLFVSIRLREEHRDHGNGSAAEQVSVDRAISALQAAGQPVVVLELNDVYDLGAEFFLWEVATATAGAILHINAFNQPNVQESKDNTNRLLADFRRTGQLEEPPVVLEARGIRFSGPSLAASSIDEYLDAFLSVEAAPGRYLAIMAYLEPSAGHSSLLDQVRLSLRDRYRLATTLGFGPRFLHSTGQFHKGGPDEGVFLQLVDFPDTDPEIAGLGFGFRTLIRAQSLGDYQALRQHGRPVVRLDLGGDVDGGLQRLVSALAGVTAA